MNKWTTADQRTRNVANRCVCGHTMWQTACAAGVLPRTPLREKSYSASPDPVAGF